MTEHAAMEYRGRVDTEEPGAIEEDMGADNPRAVETQTDDPEMSMDEPLYTEQASVERIAVNRIVDAYPQVREEGETTIVPVVEEVLVIQKRLMLKEEVRITRKRVQMREPRKLMVEDADVRGVGSAAADSR